MRPMHHPLCALSQDGIEDGDMDIPGYRAPRCTCWQHRRKEKQRRLLKPRGNTGVYIGDGVSSLGNGNYRRMPLKSGY